MEARVSETVIFVHGTFAGDKDKSDTGERWWQLGSAVFEGFRRRLPPHIGLPGHGEVFHWSGENSESARRVAAQALLSRLIDLEERGQPYHLVGHSHGGSVIWHALVDSELFRTFLPAKDEAAATKFELGNLRSWSTVGTPFISLRYQDDYLDRHWVNYHVASNCVFLLTLGLCILYGLALWPAMSTLSAAEAERFSLLSPATWPAWWYHVVGMLALLMIGFWSGALLSDRHGALFVPSLRRAIFRQTMRRFGSRWLGLRSPDDEAFAVLRISTNPFVLEIAPRFDTSIPTYATGRVIRYTLPARLVLWIYNRLVAPRLDRLLSSSLVRRVQGDDVPGGKRIFVVTPGPIAVSANDVDACPCIPDAICADLRRVADANAHLLLPEARRGFCEVGLGALPYSEFLSAMVTRLAEPQLVHSAYFHHDGVLDILCLHIAGVAVAPEQAVPAPPPLLDWIAAFKASVRRVVLDELESEPPVQWEVLGHAAGFPYLVARR